MLERPRVLLALIAVSVAAAAYGPRTEPFETPPANAARGRVVVADGGYTCQ